jgi:hypothetical protein
MKIMIFYLIELKLLDPCRRRVHRQQCMADDSDVRFLTSDEALDFSLARPIDSSDDYL